MKLPFGLQKRAAPQPGLFDTVVLPHLDGAHRLARWLVRDSALAEDVVQEAALKAFRHLATYSGGDSRAWFMRIVRNAAFDALAARQRGGEPVEDDDALGALPDPSCGPEEVLSRGQDQAILERALAALPLDLRECLVLHAIEEFSYKEIAEAVGVPIGTVMSRLWRARQMVMESAKDMRI